MTSPDTEFISILGASGSPEAPSRVSARSLPDRLPILGLSDIVIFPGMVAPLLVETPQSTKLIDDVVAGDRLLGVVLQRNAEAENPLPHEMHEVGCAARVLKMEMAKDGGAEIAKRSRGTPRVANRLLRRVRDFAAVGGHAVVDAKVADEALSRLEVDGRGLDAMDRRYLACIAENYGGGPVGVETLAAALSEQRDVIEDVIEPYLMQLGLLMRTPRGRLLSEGGYRHLGMAMPREQKQQLDLLAGGDQEDEA